jgi:hypothetical protein
VWCGCQNRWVEERSMKRRHGDGGAVSGVYTNEPVQSCPVTSNHGGIAHRPPSAWMISPRMRKVCRWVDALAWPPPSLSLSWSAAAFGHNFSNWQGRASACPPPDAVRRCLRRAPRRRELSQHGTTLNEPTSFPPLIPGPKGTSSIPSSRIFPSCHQEIY